METSFKTDVCSQDYMPLAMQQTAVDPHLTIYISVFMPIPYCSDYCSFVVLSEVWEVYVSSFVIFPQSCLGDSGSFMFLGKFSDYSSSVENIMGGLIRIN